MRQMIKWKQEGMHLPNFGMDLANPDFVKLAESMEACGHRVSAVRKSCFMDVLDLNNHLSSGSKPHCGIRRALHQILAY